MGICQSRKISQYKKGQGKEQFQSKQIFKKQKISFDIDQLEIFHKRVSPESRQNYFSLPQLSYYQRIQKHVPSEMSCNLLLHVFNYEEKSLQYVNMGSQGLIYKAFDKILNSHFIIKRIVQKNSNQNLQDDCQEGMFLGKLIHPNIVKFLGQKQQRQFLEIYLEYVANGSLQELLKKENKLDEQTIVCYTLDMLHGLECIHSNEIIHGDFKLENLLIDENNTIKICDFGSSYTINEIQKQMIRGSLTTLAPEVLSNPVEMNMWSDIWSLGCVVYQLATGQRLIKGNNYLEVFLNIEKFEFKQIQIINLSKNLKDFLFCCLQKDPRKRFNCYELLQHPFLQIQKNSSKYLDYKRASKRQTVVQHNQSLLNFLKFNNSLIINKDFPSPKKIRKLLQKNLLKEKNLDNKDYRQLKAYFVHRKIFLEINKLFLKLQ